MTGPHANCGFQTNLLGRENPQPVAREIGIRMALGAQQGNVVWLVMKETVVIVGIGFAIGLPAAWLLSRLVANLLYQIQPNDPMSIAFAMAVLGGVALLAGYVPAARAARIDPLRALHYE